MKKWIFPIVLLIIETILCILLLSPAIFSALPGFLQSFLHWIESIFTSISKALNLPASIYEGERNYIISNFIVLFILDIILFAINFIIVYIRFIIKKNKNRQDDKTIDAPKSEFDPILFERRVPTKRLAFIWVPVNFWIFYFVLLNSNDLQSSIKSSKFFYALFGGGIEIYNKNLETISGNNLGIKITLFFMGLLLCVFIYWMIFSIAALLLRKPLAKQRSKKALRDHERRASACKKEEIIIENLEILEHAKFKHDKSIVETIADIDKSKNPALISKSDYFENIAHGITDLGLVQTEIKAIEKPRVERKPIRIVYAESDNQKSIKDVVVSDEENNAVKTEDSPEAIIQPKTKIDKRFDALEKNASLNEDNGPAVLPAKPLKIKPLRPLKLRNPVTVNPVAPHRPLKDENSPRPIIEIEDK